MEEVLVLMATYNGEKYLQEQLDSLYLQKDVNVQILVRDDGSTDSTQTILEENSKKNKLMWYQGSHKNVQFGFFELMQKAVDMKYKYFAFCDQDDVWDNDKLKIAISELKSVNSMGLYYSGQRLVDANLNFIENHTLNVDRKNKARFVFSDFAGCTGVFNRALLEEIVKFQPQYMLMHDTWILRVCLALGGQVIIDPEPRMNYRQHAKNTVGLGHGIRSTFKQVKQYIHEYHIEEVTKELVRGYGNRMTKDYKEICDWICGYRNNKEYKKKLLDKSNIDFCKRGLNFTYWIKVQFNKL